MEKDYQVPEEHNQTDSLNEPVLEYDMQIEILPPLTDEELADCMTGEEFLDAVLSHIDNLFDHKRS